MYRPVLITGILLCTMSVIDTLSYGVRTAGVLTRKLAISLSLFNILVVISRLSNMFSAPILGNFPDKVYQGLYTTAQVETALRIALCFVIGGVVIGALFMPSMIRLFSRGIQVLEQVGSLPRTVAFGFRHLGEFPRQFALPSIGHLRRYSDFRVLPYQFLIYNIFVTCFYSIGVMATVLAASVDHSVAGTAILLSGIVNGIATMTLFIIVDPPAAVVVENCISGTRPTEHAKTMNVTLVLTRFLGCLLALALLPLMSRYVLTVARWVDASVGGHRSQVLGQTNTEIHGLEYNFKLIRTAEGLYRFDLQVYNSTVIPMMLSYNSGQQYDFILSDASGELWRFSAGRRYTQNLNQEELDSHHTKRVTEEIAGLDAIFKRAQGGVARVECIHLSAPDPVIMAFSAALDLPAPEPEP